MTALSGRFPRLAFYAVLIATFAFAAGAGRKW